MSLERRDIRSKLDPELHAALKIFADLDGTTEAQFIEDVLVPVLRRRIADAKVAAERLASAGIFGKDRDEPGTSGKNREAGNR